MSLRPILHWAVLAALLPIPLAHGADEELALGVRTTDPLTPAEQRTRFQLPPGFEIQLVAAEPDIHKPMNLAFDATGRLWVTTSIEYPWAAPTNRVGRDRLMIFEDFGPDGRARKVTQFANGLNIPIGVYPFRTDDRHWKAIVWSIPHIWLLEDTDGDGTCDRRTPLYGPFDHTRDTHGNQASFRRGFDGWLYATHGFNNDSHVTARDGSHVDLNSGNTYRIRLDGSRIEQHTHGQVNPFGLAWDARGNLYSSDCHSAPIYQLLHDGWYPSFGKPHDGLGFAPVMLEHAHGSTAIDGACYYNDDLWPAEFQDTFFIGNVMTSRLNRDKIRFAGSTPKAMEQPDFLTSSDPWFRPVDTCLGPDGALYVADFYNRIIGHYEVPLTHPGRDRERGRLWRVVYRGADGRLQLRSPALPQDLGGLIAELGSPSLSRRLLAMAEIEDRFGAPAIPAVRTALQQSRAATPASPAAAEAVQISSLWLQHRLGAIDGPDGLAEIRGYLSGPAQSLPRVHALRLVAERGRRARVAAGGQSPGALDPSLRTLILPGLAEGLAGRCSAEVLSAWPEFANVRPLLEALPRAAAEDTHLVYVLRKALRDQLNEPTIFQQVQSATWSDSEHQAFLDVAVAVRSPDAARYLLSRMDRLSNTTRPTVGEALQQVARYGSDSELPGLAQAIRQRYAADPATQLALYRSLDQGLRQRGATPPPAVREWGLQLMTSLLAEGGNGGWTSRPLTEAPTADPWDYQERPRAGGPSLRVLSSFPHGEHLTGVLRSPDFPAGAQIQFWLSGHDGYPDQPAAGRNAVRLRDAADHSVLLQAAPPRNDTAQRVVWDTRPYAGRQVYLEVTDADPGDAYAWLALGGLEGAPALPAVTPRGRTELLLGAAELADQLGVTPKFPQYDSLRPLIAVMRDSGADLRLRAAAVRVLIPAFRAEADLFTDTQIPVTWRRRLADSATSGDPELRKRFLSDLRREAPQRVQSRMVRALVRDRAAVRELSFAIERGDIAPGILRDPGLRDFLLGLADDDSRARLETALRTLPPVDASRSELLAERRRAFEASPGDRALGARLYEQNCAVCHQLNGQGGLVGPQLTGIGNRGAERLCEDILDPNQNVDHAFRQTRIELRNGDMLAGLFRREEGDLLVFADATGKEFSVRKGDVAEREESPVSLMPDNFAEVLPTAEFNHLLAFLLSQR